MSRATSDPSSTASLTPTGLPTPTTTTPKGNKAKDKDKEKEKKASNDNDKKKRSRRGASVAVKWFEWPREVAGATLAETVEKTMETCLSQFAGGLYSAFLEGFAAVWVQQPSWRKYVVTKWLPNLYLRHIGLGTLTTAFDIYELAVHDVGHQKSAGAAHMDTAVAKLLARMVYAHRRLCMRKWGTPWMQLGGPLTLTGSYLQCTEAGSAPPWQSPLPVMMRAPISTHMSSNTLATHDATYEWTRMFTGGAYLRQYGVTRENLFQYAMWLDSLRKHIDPNVFLTCLESIAPTAHRTDAGFRDVVDPDGRYSTVVRLFLRTMRAFLLQDVGHRVYALFYMVVVSRCISSADQPRRQEHHHTFLLEQLSDLDVFTPAVQKLQALVLSALKPTTSAAAAPSTPDAAKPPVTPPSSDVTMRDAKAVLPGDLRAEFPTEVDDNKAAVGGLPAEGGEIWARWREGLDWTHEVGRGWIGAMEERYHAPTKSSDLGGAARAGSLSAAAKAKRGPPVCADQLAPIEKHLQSLDELAEAEFDRCAQAATASQTRVDEGTIAPLPRIAWGESLQASVDTDGKLWVGPIEADGRGKGLSSKTAVGRALFRARKLREWRINVLSLSLVRCAQTPGFYLMYEGLPISASKAVELRRVMNLTKAQTITSDQIDLVDVRALSVSTLTRWASTTFAPHRDPISQIFALQIARAILGVHETGLRQETMAFNTDSSRNCCVVPTAMFQQRSSASYFTTHAVLSKLANQRRHRAETELKQLLSASGNAGVGHATPALDLTPDVATYLRTLFGANTKPKGEDFRSGLSTDSNDSKDAKDGSKGGSVESAVGELRGLKAEDVRTAEMAAVLFGKWLGSGVEQKTGVVAHLRDNVQRVDFMRDTVNRLDTFYNALRQEKELPHMRHVLYLIHHAMNHALPPDLARTTQHNPTQPRP